MAGQQEYLPSFKQGFARSAAESAHPELWRGLTAAWTPELGRTGNTVLDWSGQRLHGQCIGSLWDIDASGNLLAFSGSFSYIALPSRLPFSKNAYTYSLRVYPASSSSDQQWLLSDHYFASTNRGHGLVYRGDTAVVMLRHGSAIAATSTGIVSPLAWHHIVATYNGRSAAIWIDGVRNVTHVASATDPDAGQMSCLASLIPGSGPFSGKLASILFYSRVLSDREIRRLHRDPPALFRLRRTTGYGSRSSRPCAAYRRVLASTYGVSP